MMSLSLVTSGVAQGGGFGRSTDKAFGVVLIVRDKSVCLADIGDGAKFCLKSGCAISSHKSAKKFDPSTVGSLVIARSQDVAFASPVLGGDVLPPSVLQEWCRETKTLEEWNQLFKVSQQGESFGSTAEYEDRLKDQQTSETYKSPMKKKPQASKHRDVGKTHHESLLAID